MSISREKLRIDVETVAFNGSAPKLWVKVTLLKSGQFFYPSFEDLYRMIRAIAHCEDVKYPDGQGRDMVKRILVDSVYCSDWLYLADKYDIPDRSPEESPRASWDRQVAQQLELIDLQMVRAAVDDLRQKRAK